LIVQDYWGLGLICHKIPKGRQGPTHDCRARDDDNDVGSHFVWVYRLRYWLPSGSKLDILTTVVDFLYFVYIFCITYVLLCTLHVVERRDMTAADERLRVSAAGTVWACGVSLVTSYSVSYLKQSLELLK
jgi:hypothetical protein